MSGVTFETPAWRRPAASGAVASSAPGHEQLVLEAQDVVVELAAAIGGRAGEPERRGRLVDRAVGLGAAGELGDPPSVPEARGAVVALARVDLHASGLNTRPVGTFGKKYVDLGGIDSPASATSRTCSTGVARMKKPASAAPDSTRSMASSRFFE